LNLVAFGQGSFGGLTSDKSTKSTVLVEGTVPSLGFRSRSENKWFSHARHFPRASDGEIDLSFIPPDALASFSPK